MDADFHSDLLNRSSEKFIEMQKRIRSSVSEVFSIRAKLVSCYLSAVLLPGK